MTLIERGGRSIDRRSLVEAIANALEVAPSELLAEPLPTRGPISREAHAGIKQIGLVLAGACTCVSDAVTTRST